MLRHSLRGLAVAVIAAVALAPTPAAAGVTQLNDCADLTKAGETYILTADITEDAVCFRILADRITLDLAGHTITGPAVVGSGSVAVWDFDGARTLTVVKNGTIKEFGFGIFLRNSSRSTIRGVTTSDNGIGMSVGPTSLVKDCIVQRNLSHGIVTADGVQVENCLVGDAEPRAGDRNLGFGIIGGQRMLVTRNTANGNGSSGILVGINSTVTHNTAQGNGEDGIAVGQRSLVNYNTTNENGQDGIEAVCPATVTNNAAHLNGAMNFNPVGPNCFVQHNNFIDPK